MAGEKVEADGGGEDLYWRFESWLKQREWRSGTTIGLVGELAAIRTDAWRPIPADIAIDDLWIALDLSERGYTIAYEPSAKAFEPPVHTFRQQWERRTRSVSDRTPCLPASLASQLGPDGGLVAAEIWGHRLGPLHGFAPRPCGTRWASLPAGPARAGWPSCSSSAMPSAPGPWRDGPRPDSMPAKASADNLERLGSGRRESRHLAGWRTHGAVGSDPGAPGRPRVRPRRLPAGRGPGWDRAVPPRRPAHSLDDRPALKDPPCATSDPTRLRVLEVSYSRQVWGAELATMALARPLARRGIDLTLASPPGGDLEEHWRRLALPFVPLAFPDHLGLRAADAAESSVGRAVRPARSSPRRDRSR